MASCRHAEYGCWDCADHDKEMACVRDDLKDLIKILYKGGEISLDDIDRCVEQLCLEL